MVRAAIEALAAKVGNTSAVHRQDIPFFHFEHREIPPEVNSDDVVRAIRHIEDQATLNWALAMIEIHLDPIVLRGRTDHTADVQLLELVNLRDDISNGYKVEVELLESGFFAGVRIRILLKD